MNNGLRDKVEYKVVEKPHPKFNKEVGSTISIPSHFPDHLYEWVAEDGKARRLSLKHNTSFEEL